MQTGVGSRTKKLGWFRLDLKQVMLMRRQVLSSQRRPCPHCNCRPSTESISGADYSITANVRKTGQVVSKPMAGLVCSGDCQISAICLCSDFNWSNLNDLNGHRGSYVCLHLTGYIGVRLSSNVISFVLDEHVCLLIFWCLGWVSHVVRHKSLKCTSQAKSPVVESSW